MSPEEAKFLSDSIVDILPDDPRQALTVLALTLANVVVCTRCPEADAHEALNIAVRQMRSAHRLKDR